MVRKKPLISIVVPLYNEQEAMAKFFNDHLFPVIRKIKKYKIEIIAVNDGSTDKTAKFLDQYADKNPDFRVINFSRNFGKEVALSAGFNYAEGDAVIAIDSDGEQPPELIPKLIQKWEDGAQVVTVIRQQYGKHGILKRAGSKVFYKLLHMLGDQTTPDSTDYRIMDRVVIDEFNKLSEHNRITRGLIDWVGFETDTITAKFDDRIAGKPSYSVKKLIGLAVNSFISLSTTPLVIFGYIGIFITVISLLLGLFCLIQQYILGDPMHLEWSGAVHMTIFVTFLVGLVLISQAVSALYISHIHAETQNRPLYIVNKKKSRNLKHKD